MKQETKNKFKKAITFATLIIFLIAGFVILEKRPTFADSGFSTSHSSSSHSSSSYSSSSHSSSSHSSYSGSHSSSSSSSDDDESFFAGLIVLIIIIIVAFIYNRYKDKEIPYTPKTYGSEDNEKECIEQIKGILPNFTKEQYIKDTFKIYTDVQTAWMDFKLEDVKNVITDELYNMYESQLATLEVKGQKNIMKDMILKDSKIDSVSYENNVITISSIYIVEQYDYIADAQTLKLVNGNDKVKMRVTYEMKFRLNTDQNVKIDKCPNCGADISEMNTTTVCEYCRTKIVSDNTNWVLTEKNVLNQE